MIENSVSKSKLSRVIFASSAGTVIEWYDFYIFGILAPIISTQFFPKENPTAALLATFALFGVGFVIRPFGSIIFGRLGDLVGRKHTFLLTLLIMGGATCAIGFVPGYGTIGIASPIIVLLLRALQGLALGGEYGGATTYVAEYSPKNKRGFYTSFIQTTATLGLFISIGVILLCRSLMGEESFAHWGWRIPFLLSSILVIFSYIIRRKMHESPEFEQLKKEQKISKNPLKESFGKWSNLKWVLIALFGACAGQGVVFYTSQFYAMTFCTNALHIDAAQIQKLLLIVLLIGTPLYIFFAKLSDTWGRKWIMLTGIGLAAIFYMPIYKGMAAQADYVTWMKTQPHGVEDSTSATGAVATYDFRNGSVVTITEEPNKTTENVVLGSKNLFIIGLLILLQLVFVTMAYGPIAAFLVELFPANIRYTSMSLPYHIGNGVFGGLTPLIAQSLVVSTGNMFAGLYYPIIVAGVTFVVGVVFIKERKNSVN